VSESHQQPPNKALHLTAYSFARRASSLRFRRLVSLVVMPLLSMNGWRITKYNPAFRDGRGAYLKDEWTSVSDVGKSFEGAVLTFEEYRKIEDAYVSTAVSFVSEAGLDSLTITYLETYGVSESRAEELRDIAFDPKLAKKGMTLSREAVADVCRLVLRETFWCKLESEGGFYIHFGYDYYIYIGSPAPSEQAIAYGGRQGLFVEDMASPYVDASEA
jgi:hypothetical protein